MKALILYFKRIFSKRPAAPQKTAREEQLERQWADMLRYEGRPLYDDQD